MANGTTKSLLVLAVSFLLAACGGSLSDSGVMPGSPDNSATRQPPGNPPADTRSRLEPKVLELAKQTGAPVAIGDAEDGRVWVLVRDEAMASRVRAGAAARGIPEQALALDVGTLEILSEVGVTSAHLFGVLWAAAVEDNSLLLFHSPVFGFEADLRVPPGGLIVTPRRGQ